MIRAVEFLVSRGHDERKVLYEYSVDKLMAYVDAAHENRGNDLFDTLLVQHEPKKFLKQLKARTKNRPQPADPISKISRLGSLLRGKA